MNGRLRDGFDATGPGAVTPDGCSVELYERLPAGDQPDTIAAAVPAGAHILELGCGAGRITHPLVELGFTVTAVDESADMLERVRGARTVKSSIQALDLGETFDVVMLASFLVHADDPHVRQELLRTCRRHVANGGCVLLQREGRDWHDDVPRERPLGADGVVRVLSSDEVSSGVRSVRVEYVYPDARWTQTFLSRPLTRGAFESALADAGLAVDTYLTDDGVWVRALPVALKG
jgi:SAM-dependent methyltransferase